MRNRAGVAVVVGVDPGDEPVVLNVATVMKGS